MLCVLIISIFVYAACSGSSLFGPPDGYLSTRSGSVAFLQFTENNHQLSGHMQEVDQTNDVPPQTKTHSYAFTGTQNGTSITLSFPVLWSSMSFTGTFVGDTITLDMPQDDGHLANNVFKGSSTQQYNDAIDALQKGVSQQDQQYYNDQATAEAIQATATAIQDEQDAVSNANYYLKNALSALKSSDDTFTSFSVSDTLSAYAKGWQQMQNDYKKEQGDAANGCGENNYNQNTVQYDDNTVGYDYNSITYDDNSLSYDKNTYDSELSAVQDALQSVKDDWVALQNAVKANTTGTPAPAYTQSDIDTATTNAQNTENTASNIWTSAKTSAGTYDNEASDLKKKADAIPGNMGCS